MTNGESMTRLETRKSLGAGGGVSSFALHRRANLKMKRLNSNRLILTLRPAFRAHASTPAALW
jgi:hypothetical protein